MVGQPFDQLLISTLAKSPERVAHVLAKFFGVVVIARDAHDRKFPREQVLLQKVVDRREQLTLGKVSGGAEDDHHTRSGALGVGNVRAHVHDLCCSHNRVLVGDCIRG